MPLAASWLAGSSIAAGQFQHADAIMAGWLQHVASRPAGSSIVDGRFQHLSTTDVARLVNGCSPPLAVARSTIDRRSQHRRHRLQYYSPRSPARVLAAAPVAAHSVDGCNSPPCRLQLAASPVAARRVVVHRSQQPTPPGMQHLGPVNRRFVSIFASTWRWSSLTSTATPLKHHLSRRPPPPPQQQRVHLSPLVIAVETPVERP